jgi:hypothetical protein
LKLENINIDLESIKHISDELNPRLKEIHLRYCDSIEQILTLISSPLIFMSFAMRKVKENHLSIEKAVKLGFFMNNPPKEPKDAAKHLVDFFQESIETASKTVVEDSIKESNSLYENNAEIRKCFENIGRNAIVNTWTLFETYSKEIWIKSFNEKPNLINSTIINANNNSNSPIFDKNIPLNLLSRYGFDVSKHLGEILSVKYDFTACNGIKKSFKDLLSLRDNEIGFMDNENLNQMEIIRHILVHNSGIVDNKYLSRSKRQNEQIGLSIELEVEELNKMINASINSIKDLFKLANEKTNC